MAEELMKSLANLENMLKDISESESPIEPHAVAVEENKSETENKFSIGNGAYVRIEDDRMKAWIYLNPPKEGEGFYGREEILKFLIENGVVKGFHTSNIAAIAKKHIYGREVIAAKGEEPYEGKNGYYEFFFDTSDKRKPLIREDGTVDYASMSQLTNVEAGQMIARYHHAIACRNGFDVLGKEIQAKPSRDLPILKGRGFNCDANPDEYVANISGKIDYKNGHIDIKDVHEVRGDVDLITGKVEFFGDIHIQGNVGAGVVIRASRNVTIDGVVESATIYAGGDVVLKRGIQGNQKGSVIAKGNVSADFIELAHVEAGENIRSNSFINSDVYAAGMVMAEGKNGVIIGGETHGLKGVSAVTFGNDAYTKTHIASGYSAEDYEKYIAAYQRENDAQKKLAETVEQMTEILKNKRLGKDKTPEKTDQLLVILNEKKDEFFEALDNARTEKDNLSTVIENGKGSVIVANDKIYRGVTVTVEGTSFQIPEDTSFMRYRNEGGRIVPTALVL